MGMGTLWSFILISMYKRISVCILISAIVLSGSAKGQQTFFATVHFPSYLNPAKLSIIYNDGKSRDASMPVKSYTVNVSGPLYARYAAVLIFYHDSGKKNGSSFSNIFWVGQDSADINFTTDTSDINPFSRFTLRKALDKAAMGATQMDSFQQAEWTAFDGFLRSHPHGMTDSLQVQERFRLGKRLREKELVFIRSHSNLYYSLWFFRTELTSTWYIDTDTLLSVFNSFPDSLRQSTEGAIVMKALRARIDSREGMMAPHYAARTIKGDSISLGINAGKYVLLDFWASWCGPCRAEMPLISELKSQFVGKQFSIISVSLDRNRKDFDSALAKYKMDWPQVFGDWDLIKAFNVSAIPAIFLIDPAGRIIYKDGEVNTSGTSTSDPELKRLIAMLGERLR